MDRVWLTPFSAPLESTRSPEVNSPNRRAQKLNDPSSATGASVKTFYAMRRANGDWFAVADKGDLRMPIFKNRGDAMTARLRDSGMECFRPVTFDASALEELRRTDGHTASFLMITDPSRHLKHGLRLGFSELAPLMMT